MHFSEQTLIKAWERAGGRCEGLVEAEGQRTVCSKLLVWEKKNSTGELKPQDGWIALPRMVIRGKVPDMPGNCRILCPDCHQHYQPLEILMTQ